MASSSSARCGRGAIPSPVRSEAATAQVWERRIRAQARIRHPHRIRAAWLAARPSAEAQTIALGGDSVWPTRERKRDARRGGVAPARGAALGQRWRGSLRATRSSAPPIAADARHLAAAAQPKTQRPWFPARSACWWAVFLGSQASVAAWHRWPSSQDANAWPVSAAGQWAPVRAQSPRRW